MKKLKSEVIKRKLLVNIEKMIEIYEIHLI